MSAYAEEEVVFVEETYCIVLEVGENKFRNDALFISVIGPNGNAV